MQDHGVRALIVALVSINENTIDAKLTTKLQKKISMNNIKIIYLATRNKVICHYILCLLF